MHMHARVTMPRTAGGEPIRRFCTPAPCTEHPAAAKTDEDILRLTLEAMDRHNIVLGLLSDQLEHIVPVGRGGPGTLPCITGFVRDPAVIDPDFLRQEYDAGRLQGTGELGNQYAGIQAMIPVWSHCLR